VTEQNPRPSGEVDSGVETFALKAELPVRALALAAVTALLGAGIWVLAGVADLPLVVTILGAGLLVLALALAVAASVMVARVRSTVQVDRQQITLTEGTQVRSAAWADIHEVTLKDRRLTLASRGDGTPDLIIRNPRTVIDPTFRALLVSVQSHLDADRGYSPLA